MRDFIKICGILFLILLSIPIFGQEVILIRHAEVVMDDKGWVGPKKAAAYHIAYDTNPILQFNPDTVLAKLPRRKTDTVYVSGLPRSIASGWKLFGDSAILVSMDLLNEFELHVVRLPLILPYKAWTSVSRALWLVGVKNQDTESHKEGKKRAKHVADFIEKKTQNNDQVILVAHGFLNHTIAKEMKKRGWHKIQNEGNKNLGATILVK